MQIKIVYEDSEIVVVEKPSGVVVNRAETVKVPTMQDWMAERYPELWDNPQGGDYFVERLGMVHRLDKETSGLMIFAKSKNAFEELLRQFRERETEKKYSALTHGIWKVKEGVISLPIGRRRDNRQRMGVREDGRESETGYRVLREWSAIVAQKEMRVDTRGYQGFSLVEFSPKTGRMHQIRVHARHVGHPLVGDEQYAGRKRSREDRKWAGRVLLHACSLSIIHPDTKERMVWTSQAPFPEDLDVELVD